MHAPNHLLSPETSLVGGAVALVLLGVALSKTLRDDTSRQRLPLTFTLVAFTFAIQMLNFAIGDVGCSGHLIGGILLAALLGRWLGFLALSGVLFLQSLLFADGGIMTLGCNILNMAALGCLVCYPLIFLPIARGGTSPIRIFLAGTLSSVVAVELGALALVVESTASGSALPMWEFMGFMLPVHLVIGAIEGVVTGSLLALITTLQPAMLDSLIPRSHALRFNPRNIIAGFALSALIIGGGVSLVASERPDGLEWSIRRAAPEGTLTPTSHLHRSADALQQQLAVAPDYEGSHTGILTTASILFLAWISGSKKRREESL